MAVNHVSDIIGDFGKWQLNIAAFYFTFYILSPFNNFGITFHAPKVNYWCQSYTNNNDSSTYYYISNNNSSSVVCENCDKWKYDDEYKSTIVSEWNLICDKSWLPSFSQSCFQLGYVANGLILGYLSDRFGRRPALWLAVSIEIISGLCLISSQSITQYIISRFFLGLGDSGRGVCLYMLIVETVGSKYRSDITMTMSFGWVIGYVLLPAIAYLVRHFRYIQMFPTVAAILLAALWLWSIPESPRWQMTHNKVDKANVTILNAAKVNGYSTDGVLEKLTQLERNSESNQYSREQPKHKTILDLIMRKQLRKYTLIFWFTFAINAFIYQGVSLNIGEFGGNLFVNFAIAGIVEIPSILLTMFGLRYFGRRNFTAITMLLASIANISIVVLMSVVDKSEITGNYLVIRMVFAMIGKLFIFSSFNAIYIHAAEIFPTVLRHTAIGSCSVAARFGSILAPFVKEISELFHLSVSLTIFSLLSFTAAAITLYLPETKGRELADNIVEIDDIMSEGSKKVNADDDSEETNFNARQTE